jgi:hypothetical protein
MIKKLFIIVVFLGLFAGTCAAQEAKSPLRAQKDRVGKVLAKKPVQLAVIQPIGPASAMNPLKRVAAELGVEIITLTGIQMADPNVFNPKNYPVIIYAGLEKAARDYKGKDLLEAVKNYMSGGGTLISTGGCWPLLFACDWDGSKWADKELINFGNIVGVFIASIWEKPPEELTVVLKHDPGDKVFASLPKEIPYPARGDVRLRVFDSAAAEGEGGNYRPAFTVEDSDGGAHGDAIAIYERPSDLGKSTVIFIWGTLVTTQYADGILADAFAYALERSVK